MLPSASRNEIPKGEQVTAQPFYVYQLVDPRTGGVFYIGKGQKKRAWVHLSGRSHNARVNARVADIQASGLSAEVEIIQCFATEAEAINAEADLICASEGLLNILARGWALTPEQAQIRLMEKKEREMAMLGYKHRDHFVRRIADLSRFKSFGLPGVSDEFATKVVLDALDCAKSFVAKWDDLSQRTSHAA